ncbi:hypothetical protein BBP40_008702 [Aspergillus hancockii]|nr:hypothetical protein BBP40_008702 [Aspergillus hancockii]
MAPFNNLTSQLKHSSSAKRKRDTKYTSDDSDKENDKTHPTKATKTQTETANSVTPTKTYPVGLRKEAKKLYTDCLKALDKRVDELDKKVKTMSGNSSAITTSNYATSARKDLGTVKKLATMDTTLAINLLLSMADASHTDLDATLKMCGTPCDNSIPTFKLLDDTLLPLLEARERPTSLVAELPEVPRRWTLEDADGGVFKTGRPNKQQRGQMYRQKLAWEKKRRQARRERREQTGDWVKVALRDLVEERDYLAAYGVQEYLPRCIAKLDALCDLTLGSETVVFQWSAPIAHNVGARLSLAWGNGACTVSLTLAHCSNPDNLSCLHQIFAAYSHGRAKSAATKTAASAAQAATQPTTAGATSMRLEEQRLRDMPGDMLTSANVFENGVGHFRGIASVHARAQDQTAYDFMKWHATTWQEYYYSWSDMGLPFLDIKDGDVLEPPTGMWTDERWLDLNHFTTILLVKVRVLVDLPAVQNATSTLNSNILQELIDLIRGGLVGSIVESRREILRGNTEEISRLVERIQGQEKELYVSIDNNPHFWPSMLNGPAAAIAVKPAGYTSGTQEEAFLMLSCNFAA